MLIEFRASNYRSIGDEQILSMVPSMNQKEYPENILTQGKYNSLIALSIYGANGSGKSNYSECLCCDGLYGDFFPSVAIEQSAALRHIPVEGRLS